MIHNPWYVENTASYYRQQVQDEMRQIRLQEKAMKAHDMTATRSPSKPPVLRAVRHATLALAKAIVVVLLG